MKRPSNFVTPVRWFELGDQQIHLIPNDEPDVVSPRHMALHVDDVRAARGALTSRGEEVRVTVPIAGVDRFFIADPDANDIKRPLTGFAERLRSPGPPKLVLR